MNYVFYTCTKEALINHASCSFWRQPFGDYLFIADKNDSNTAVSFWLGAEAEDN